MLVTIIILLALIYFIFRLRKSKETTEEKIYKRAASGEDMYHR